MRPQGVIANMGKILGQGNAPAPQTNLPPPPQIGPDTGAKATNINASAPPPKDAATKLPAWKNFGLRDNGIQDPITGRYYGTPSGDKDPTTYDSQGRRKY